MKLYRIRAFGHNGCYLRWASTRAQVRIRRAEMAEELAGEGTEGAEIKTDRIDFPTTQAGIADWLDRNFNRDNG